MSGTRRLAAAAVVVASFCDFESFDDVGSTSKVDLVCR